jgi:Cu/Ag efflux pump CusA
MTRTSRTPWLLLAVLLLPFLAGVAVVLFLGYRFLARTLPFGGVAAEAVTIEVVAPFPGASPEEVERQVAIPLEVGLAGMPGLQTVRSRSVNGGVVLRLQFENGRAYDVSRHEVINRLQFIQLPPAVVAHLSSALPGREVLRYTLVSPKDALGNDIYTPSDLKALQDWSLERAFRMVPRVADCAGSGGAVKRYEVQMDPDRLRRYGISVLQLQNALAQSNQNVGGDPVIPQAARSVRGIGLFGGGEDPAQAQAVRQARDPRDAARFLRAEEQRRLREIRQTVVATINNVPIRVEDVVERGRLGPDAESQQGAVVEAQRRHGQVALCRERGEGAGWLDEERVQGVVLLRPGEDAEATLRDVRARVEELNAGGVLLPGVRVEPFLERGGRPEDGFWMRAEFPANLERGTVAERLRDARAFLREQPEVAALLTQAGGPDETVANPGTAVVFVRLRPSATGSRERKQLQSDIADGLRERCLGVLWTYCAGPPDDFAEGFEPAAGELVLKVFGRDLDGLQEVAAQTERFLQEQAGVESVHRLDGGRVARLDLRVDHEKCARWGVRPADVNLLIQCATGGHAVSPMVEGEKLYDLVLCWPPRLVRSEAGILDLPVDASMPVGEPLREALPNPANPPAEFAARPRLRLRDLVTPMGEDGEPNPEGAFVRRGVAAIYRENGQRFVAVRFRLGRASLDDVRGKVTPRIAPPYRTEWIDRSRTTRADHSPG